MSKTIYESMYDEYKTFFPSYAKDTVSYKPCGKSAITVLLSDKSEFIYDAMDNALFHDKTGQDNETDEDYIKRKIHKRLKFFMSNRRCTQEELCERTGLTQATISRYITGKAIPSVLNLYKIAKALDCKIEDIIN